MCVLIKKICIVLIICIFPSFIHAQYPISGRLLNSDNEAVVGASVGLKDEAGAFLNIATTSDLDGFFVLTDVPKARLQLVISYVGYQDFMQWVEVNGEVELGKIELLSGLNATEVIEVRAENNRLQSPVQMATTITMKTIIQPDFLADVNAPTNLMETISAAAGVQEVVACGVCNTNSISINGLPGQYTAVLIDGTPMYGNLAAVYGLNGIPTALIDRIEITKGPASTIFGSEAVAGVVNVITKSPKQESRFSVDWMGTNEWESYANIGASFVKGKWSGLLGSNYAYSGSFFDDNKDGFGDAIGLDRVSAFTKWQLERKNNRRFSFLAKYYYEDRRNGVEEFLKRRAYRYLRGSDSVYGESIYTHRWELLGTYELPIDELIKIDYSFSGHYQNSYYGSDAYLAKQYIGFVNGIWNKYIKGHGISTGITLRYQFYDDNTSVTRDSTGVNKPDQQWIPGVFVQDAWDISKKLSLQYGCRLDYYQHHSLIPAPRFNLRYKPTDWTTLRLNFGTGFRVVNLFAEDHAFVTGNRQVVITDKLRPERSYNLTLNFNQVYTLGMSQGMIDVDAYYTHFTNAIRPDYSQANQVIYSNLDGYAQTMGITVTANQQFAFPLIINLGANVQRVTMTERDDQGEMQTRRIEFAPDWAVNWIVSYTWRKAKMTFSYSGRVVGAMQLPLVHDLDANGNPLPSARPTRSRPYTMQTLQITKNFPKIGLSIFAGVWNLFNYRQPLSPISGYNDPNTAVGYSPYFDTAYAYATVNGREFYIGLRFKR